MKDSATETWLEKARYDGNGGTGIFPNRRIPASGSSSSLVRGATPASWNDFSTRIRQLGNRMRFTRTGNLDSTPTPYDPAVHTLLSEGTVYEVSVRVKVCDSSIGVEANCVREILAENQIGDFGVRVVEEGAVGDLTNADGWYMDLVSPNNDREGERMVVPNRFQGSVLIGTTRIPEAGDACRPGGRGFVMAINPFTGGRLDTKFFDVSRDGEFTNSDMLMVDGVLPVVSGVGLESSPNNPIFVEEYMHRPRRWLDRSHRNPGFGRGSLSHKLA